MSKFSIIVPIFNSEKYLEKCIKSILNQTYKNFELILVNDGSKDGSLEICNKYLLKDSRVRVIDKDNEGSISSRNRGVIESKSEYVTFIDSDDWIAENTLEIVNKHIEESDSDVAIFNMYKVIDKFGVIKKCGNKEYFNKYSIVEGDEIRKSLVSAYFHGHPFPSNMCAKVYKRKFLIGSGKYLKNIKFLGDDLFYNLEVLLKVEKITMINRALYYYRCGGGTSKYMPYLFNDMIEGFKVQKKVIEEYYNDTYEKRYNGATAMLLNTFKVCISNLFLSDYNCEKIREKIAYFLNCNEIIEASKNERKRNYFEDKFLKSILNKDTNYFYNMGEEMYKSNKINRIIKKVLA